MEKVKVFIGFALGMFLVFASWVAVELALLVDDTRILVNNNAPAITATVNDARDTTKKGKELAERVNQFATVDRLKNLDNAVNTQIYATQQTTNNYGAIADETVRTLRNHVQPGINDLRAEGKQTFADLRGEIHELQTLTKELTHQVQQNGDEIKELLAGTRSLIAHSEGELITTLQNINKLSAGANILVNDPALKELIQNSNLTIGNIEVITGELADLSKHVIEPITNPKPAKGFNKYFFQPTIKILRVLNGAGQVFFIINRLGG